MKRFRTPLIGLLGLGLVAGPVAAVCADCCPPETTEASILVPPDCCGDCEASVEQSKDGVAALAAKAVAHERAAGLAGSPSPAVSIVRAEPLHVHAGPGTHRPPPFAAAPLRL
jgi:hypothetical protein